VNALNQSEATMRNMNI